MKQQLQVTSNWQGQTEFHWLAFGDEAAASSNQQLARSDRVPLVFSKYLSRWQCVMVFLGKRQNIYIFKPVLKMMHGKNNTPMPAPLLPW